MTNERCCHDRSVESPGSSEALGLPGADFVLVFAGHCTRRIRCAGDGLRRTGPDQNLQRAAFGTRPGFQLRSVRPVYRFAGYQPCRRSAGAEDRGAGRGGSVWCLLAPDHDRRDAERSHDLALHHRARARRRHSDDVDCGFRLFAAAVARRAGDAGRAGKYRGLVSWSLFVRRADTDVWMAVGLFGRRCAAADPRARAAGVFAGVSAMAFAAARLRTAARSDRAQNRSEYHLCRTMLFFRFRKRRCQACRCGICSARAGR